MMEYNDGDSIFVEKASINWRVVNSWGEGQFSIDSMGTQTIQNYCN